VNVATRTDHSTSRTRGHGGRNSAHRLQCLGWQLILRSSPGAMVCFELAGRLEARCEMRTACQGGSGAPRSLRTCRADARATTRGEAFSCPRYFLRRIFQRQFPAWGLWWSGPVGLGTQRHAEGQASSSAAGLGSLDRASTLKDRELNQNHHMSGLLLLLACLLSSPSPRRLDTSSASMQTWTDSRTV